MGPCCSTYFLQGALFATFVELFPGSADGGLLLVSQLGLVLSNLLCVLFLVLHVLGHKLFFEVFVSLGPFLRQNLNDTHRLDILILLHGFCSMESKKAEERSQRLLRSGWNI